MDCQRWPIRVWSAVKKPMDRRCAVWRLSFHFGRPTKSEIDRKIWIRGEGEPNIFENFQHSFGFYFITTSFQFNLGTTELRRKPQELRHVNVPFDANQFNFNRVACKEILFVLKVADADRDHALIVNASPFEFGSCLLVPSIRKCIRQEVTLEGLTLLINLMLQSHDKQVFIDDIILYSNSYFNDDSLFIFDWTIRNLRSGFSSAGGYASVNHQHYHLYYLPDRLYLENAAVENIAGPCYTVRDFPAKGFAFQLENNNVRLLVRYALTTA